jgi:hypothetical protein
MPFTKILRKTVVFITTTCLHQPSAADLTVMTPEAVANLSPLDREEWQMEVEGVLTPETIAQMTPERKARVRADSYSGTGFLVAVPDTRLPNGQVFEYLVTNHHVTEPNIEPNAEQHKPCNVLTYAIALNHKGKTPEAPIYSQNVVFDTRLTWYYSDDPSVDIAVTNFVAPPEEWDSAAIPISLFATQDMLKNSDVIEGDNVIFAGLFVQYVGSSRFEPIVRSGSIAMIPNDRMQTTLGTPGRVYLTEAHAFGGNSGSPMFVDINKFKSGGYDYRLLGVVAGEVFEKADFSLQVATSYNGAVQANSNISMVVPADEVRAIIEGPALQKLRDAAIAGLHK